MWALGCVIVEMLTGKMPWADMPMQQIMMAVAVQFRVPTVPEGAPAADMLGRCFAKLPRDRPTAEQLAEAFVTAAPPAPAPSPVLEVPRSTLQDEELQKLRKDLKGLPSGKIFFYRIEIMDREEQNKLLDTGIRLKDDFLDLEMQDLANVINSLACPRENASRDLLGSRGRKKSTCLPVIRLPLLHLPPPQPSGSECNLTKAFRPLLSLQKHQPDRNGGQTASLRHLVRAATSADDTL